ncbi:hydroxymethylglutaryl-CoA reductase, degradative [Pseudogracilibacillus sp. SE30717A]|uniref:hydroxymethylglutaryl-CoA reductase, degradative n=1 Tax=Pseudogracilibacillus sp. SE30717A TaxID=3098293 RepID=UPI00300E50B5
MNSRIPNFYKLNPQQRVDEITRSLKITKEEWEKLHEKGLTLEEADKMIENVIGIMPVPLGVAANFKIDGKDVFIPMATEEPSVVAAASHAAKLAYDQGGFYTSSTGSVMRGQIQIIHVKKPYYTMAKIYENKDLILQVCNQQDETLVALGGGAIDVKVDVLSELNMLIIHVFVDTKDAMGANVVNTMLENVTPTIEAITEEEVGIRIISNLADRRIVRATATFHNYLSEINTQKFIQAYELAKFDPYRAATHNKGIMNGISAVALATGNDTRAIEAGAHAFAARSGHYKTLSHWEIDKNNNIVGTIELPLAVGIIGGATMSNPVAKLSIKMMRISHAEQLAKIMAATGLAQNFAALSALVTEGIQKGHMKLHARKFSKDG